ncbi:helix-turn-helix transcriptional regulator [Pseudoclavibacter helvolus]|uniref:helix-turn-helix transcriptional regulator n=1 Tax=Pseudoclavibacter helvolus TaxID=255205 RepID=UPI0008395B54|nr:helix-turn-helix domain-containing protein [Pseudoclavibacter helvolus]
MKPHSRLMLVPEVAERLNKSPSQLRWMIHKGTAPRSGIIGGRRMFREEDVEAFIDAAFEKSEA